MRLKLWLGSLMIIRFARSHLRYGPGAEIIWCAMCEPQKQRLQPLENLRQPMPLARKLRLLLANNFTKIRTLKGCCGNHGQPGC